MSNRVSSEAGEQTGVHGECPVGGFPPEYPVAPTFASDGAIGIMASQGRPHLANGGSTGDSRHTTWDASSDRSQACTQEPNQWAE